MNDGAFSFREYAVKAEAPLPRSKIRAGRASPAPTKAGLREVELAGG